MKVLIWLGYIFGLSLFIVILKNVGIILGGIPTALLFWGMLWLARALCKKWDEHKAEKGDDHGKN